MQVVGKASREPGVDALLSASVELCTAAEAHSELLILLSFSNGIKRHSSDNLDRDELCGVSDLKAMRSMLLLLAVSIMGRHSGQFLAAGVVIIEDFSMIGDIYICVYIYIYTYIYIYVYIYI
jgi:hypothetical protein